MVTLLFGHVAIGLGFLLIGLWHLFNHIKLHSLNPKTYTSHSWFPYPTFRYLEPTLIIIGSAFYILMELFIAPSRHQPFDVDGSIPSYHLHNFEHSAMSLSFLIHALFSIVFDKTCTRRSEALLGLGQLVVAFVFCQELLLIHTHSTDHAGPEGQYHWLFEVVIAVALGSSIVAAWRPRSFLVSFVRSLSVAFQGVWLIVIAFALWEPMLMAKGCFLRHEEWRVAVRCRDKGAVERAKALANLEFSWALSWVVVLSLGFYLVLGRWYACEEYMGLSLDEGDLESQREVDECEGFVQFGRVVQLKSLKS